MQGGFKSKIQTFIILEYFHFWMNLLKASKYYFDIFLR